jgi:biopolymer transport protein ExbB
MTSVFTLILQITTQATDTIQTVTAPEELSILELMMKGGIVMIPIILLWIIATYIFIERYLYLRTASKVKRDFITNIANYLQAGDIKTALMYSSQERTATAAIIRSGLSYVGRPLKEIESIMESAANIEIGEMEKNVGYLGIIAGIAPMLGFIGTISGIINIFYNISLADNISIGLIAGGLYEKMITSGMGLVVGVLAYAGYHFLHQRVNKFSLQMQKDVFEFIRSIMVSAK